MKLGTYRRLRRWEAALMAGVAIALLSAAWLDGEQAALAEKVLRLHVIAASDDPADQALKLEVRDQVLARAGEVLEGAETVEEAAQALQGALPELAAAGEAAVRAAGRREAVTASLEEDVWFPTKVYQDFALPQGRYTALRVTIGEGAGENWWCVVFPPLCLGSVAEITAETAAGLSREDVALITGETQGYVVKFKALELWEEVRGWIEGRG